MGIVDFSLKDKIAIVTGASRGIGEAISKAFAEYGAHVILASRKIEGLKRVEDDIISSGGRATSIVCHTGKMDHINNLYQEVKERFNRLDILVNNAATNPFFGSVLDAEESVWDKTVDVNLKGCFFMSQKASILMKDSGGGAIVNIASINAEKPGFFQGIYSITKSGVVGLTKAFAKEVAQYNIRVNAILPGMIDTKFSATLTKNPEILKSVLPQIPLARIAKPDEMAGLVVYLVSDAASYTTGSCIIADGGFLA